MLEHRDVEGRDPLGAEAVQVVVDGRRLHVGKLDLAGAQAVAVPAVERGGELGPCIDAVAGKIAVDRNIACLGGADQAGLGYILPRGVDLEGGGAALLGCREVGDLERLVHVPAEAPVQEAVVRPVAEHPDIALGGQSVLAVKVSVHADAQLRVESKVGDAAGRIAVAHPDDVRFVRCRRAFLGGFRIRGGRRCRAFGSEGIVNGDAFVRHILDDRVVNRGALDRVVLRGNVRIRPVFDEHVLDRHLVGVGLVRRRAQRPRGRRSRQPHRRQQECGEDGDDAARSFLVLHGFLSPYRRPLTPRDRAQYCHR